MDESRPIIDVTAHPADFVPSNDVWAFLRRRIGSITLFFVLGLVAAFWCLLSRPYLYEAESRVMIVRTGSGGPVSEAELASEIELIQDPSHLDRTAAKQRPNQSDNQIHDLQQKIESYLKVAPAGKSNLVSIQYRDTDATAAARIVNQIVEFYLADRRAIFQPGSRTSIDFGSRADQDLLSAFDAVNHGPLLRTELQTRFQRRLELESRLAELKAQIRDHQEAVVVLRKRLTALPERIHSGTRTRTGGTPVTRQVEETEIVNPLRQQIDTQILNNDSAAAGLQARLEETGNLLRQAKVAEERASGLSSERDKIERRTLDARAAAADPAGSMDRPNLRATLVNRAEPPYGPLPRRTLLWSPVAILAALAFAFLIAWLVDQFDKPIYTSGDFERASGVPPMDDFSRGAGA